MTYYYVLWIPVLKKGIPAILRQTLPEKELKDLPEHNALIIKGTIDNSYDIRIAYRLSGENKDKTLLFHSEQRVNEGFMIYSLELLDSEEDFFCKSLSCGMHSAVYHYIKGFFHKHRFHFDSEDSLLPAYFSCEKINWGSTDARRNIIQPLIRCYSLKFTGYLNDWENGFYKAFEEISNNKHITRNIYILQNTLQISRNIFGEMQYCKFLMSSFPTLVPRKSKSEIQNTLSELIQLHDSIQFWYNHYVGKISFLDGRKGVRWGVIGVIISTVSILLTFYLEFHAPDINKVSKQNERHQDSISVVTLHCIERSGQEIGQRQDSIQTEFRQMSDRLNILERKISGGLRKK